MAIRITSMPAGQAPEEIRRAWIGLILPTVGESSPTTSQIGVLGGPSAPENRGGYEVLVQDAVEALEKAGRIEASNWWEDMLPFNYRLVFGKMFCELVPEPAQDLTYAEGGLGIGFSS